MASHPWPVTMALLPLRLCCGRWQRTPAEPGVAMGKIPLSFLLPSGNLTVRTWKYTPGKGDSYWKPSFLGATLVSGRVNTIKICRLTRIVIFVSNTLRSLFPSILDTVSPFFVFQNFSIKDRCIRSRIGVNIPKTVDFLKGLRLRPPKWCHPSPRNIQGLIEEGVYP